MQGTLDYYCGIYAVINALACMDKIDLSTSRTVLSETVLDISKNADLFEQFMRNRTNHYWTVAYTLARWTKCGGLKLESRQAFNPQWMPGDSTPATEILKTPELFKKESEPEDDDEKKVDAVWKKLKDWLETNNNGSINRTAIIRFHRYLAGIAIPVVSHWSTAYRLTNDVLYLHDASGEPHALHTIKREDLNLDDKGVSPVRIVPESIVLLKSE